MNLHTQESTGHLAPVRKIGDVWLDGGKAWERCAASTDPWPVSVYRHQEHDEDEPIIFAVRHISGLICLTALAGHHETTVTSLRQIVISIKRTENSALGRLLRMDEVEVRECLSREGL